MTPRLEMLQAAGGAPDLLGESTGLVRGFFLRQQNADGGFKDRAGKSDLYYTVFGLDGLAALAVHASGSTPPGPDLMRAAGRARPFLYSYGDGAGLDFVHLCCLARAWGALLGLDSEAESCPGDTAAKILRRIEDYRSSDGGYNPILHSESGTAYGAFLALGAHLDLTAVVHAPRGRRRGAASVLDDIASFVHRVMPARFMPAATRLRRSQLIASLRRLETPDGAYTNQQSPTTAPPSGSTNATAAAVTVLRHLGAAATPSAADWLLARAPLQGGFLAIPGAPMPDLLSTATALHALAGLGVSFDSCGERCLDFIDSLWSNEGGFYGHWGDEFLDCEYTFYALLALGHLKGLSRLALRRPF
jgi:prenyltransferase beta subunit